MTAQLIEQHYRDPGFDGDAVARMLYLSRRHMYRFFADTEDTPAVLIARRRLAHARELLVRQPRMSLREVAAASGFTSAGTLSKRFSAEFGLTPSQFRQAVREGGADAGD
ncbi:helix-turn-helix domain-containing protein [Gordonia alkaliphila]|uniref:helix-turn-helix domain-containing protein n=1 Tax=Gordonia alkaliphila TaxID=1053547 RepID=UPI001FF51C28|nr:helix-turn-helix domain-containing protein [Gordonia alkaliphila]MCK0440267.1 helix-turn-helix domain-containing protein [Gordonia alkaliphila]